MPKHEADMQYATGLWVRHGLQRCEMNNVERPALSSTSDGRTIEMQTAIAYPDELCIRPTVEHRHRVTSAAFDFPRKIRSRNSRHTCGILLFSCTDAQRR